MKTLALILAVIVAFGAAEVAAGAQRARYKRCRHEHLSVNGATGGSLPVAHLRVIHISCADAATAITAGTYEATPGGPLFSTKGFACTSPIGPPPPGSKPRYYRCHSGIRRFEFLVPGFS